ncbi:MAG TPA: sigma-70 family RNA polymerase sigma factor [Terriglobales bacterium]|nr:sigma-70 family RNA polymerase sigma factor [Terriglobales bacterium]
MENSEMGLVNLACEGDREAFWRLVQPHLHAVNSTARAILMNLADSEEVAQESVLKALRNICRFRGEAKFSTWLIQITINEAKSRLRKDHGYLYRSLDEPQKTNGDEYFPRDFTDWREIPSEALERKELRKALEQALACLPQKYREVFTLRDIAHLSIDETAQVLGLTLGSVKSRLLRARLQMRDALAPGFGGSWSKSAAQYQGARA